MTRRVSGGITGSLSAGGLSISSSTIIPTTANVDLNLLGPGTGSIVVNDPLVVTNNTASTNTSTGALRVSGGLNVEGDLYVAGALGSGLENISIGASTPASGSFTSLTATGLTTIAEAAEIISTKSSASGVVTHSFSEANTWVHSSISNNFTVDLTGVPTTNDRVITVKLMLNQSFPGYYANGFQIDGVAQTINWESGSYPIPSDYGIDIQTFNLTRNGSSWNVSSSVNSYDASYYRIGLRWYYDAGVAASAPTGGNGTSWVNLAPGGGSVNTSGSDFSYSTATGIGTVFGNTNRPNVNSYGIPIDLTTFNKLKGTLEFWVYPTAYVGGNGLFVNRSDSTANDQNWFWVGFWDSGNNGYFRAGSNATASCCNNDNSGIYSGAIFPLNQWHQVTFTWDFSLGRSASYSSWWKNGELIKTFQIIEDIGSSNVSSTGLLFNGHSEGTNSTFKGHCSIVRHYNIPLTKEQILQNFNVNRTRHGI